MEKNLVKKNIVVGGGGGEVRLPPGFRFHPTDEELVVQYLKRKVFSYPLPAAIIPEVDLCNSDPWDLPGDMEQERYFFSTKEAKYPNGKRSNRATNSGYWKATGLDKQIVVKVGAVNNSNLNNNNNQVQVVGMKKTLVFYRGKPPHGLRTDWIMHEYRLHQEEKKHMQENWVLCRIFLKRRNSASNSNSGGVKSKNGKKEEEEELEEAFRRRQTTSSRVVFYDFLAHNNTDFNNRVASKEEEEDTSGITQVSITNENEEQETSSSSNTFRTTTKPQH